MQTSCCPTHGPGAGYWRDLVRPLLAGRKFVFIGGPVAGMAPVAAQARALGAARPFLLGSGIGTGTLPRAEDADWFALEIAGGGLFDAIRGYERALLDLPDTALEALDRYDPERGALVCGGLFLDGVERIAGRRRFGVRSRAFGALEDKSVIDAFWDACRVPRAASEVVPFESASLRAASRKLDRGAGCVWSGDASEGPNGGAAYVRWVRTEADARAADAFFASRCRRVRVMPFLEGIPCSIHGLVFPEGVAVLRPLEMITLRRPGQPEFAYAGSASFWDPAPWDRAEMRGVARRVARALRDRGYRGGFSVDGVLAAEGFRPTELNPRFSAGLNVFSACVPEVPLGWLAYAAQAGHALAFRPSDLEACVVEAIDRVRGGSGMAIVPRRFEATQRLGLVFEADRYRLAREGEDADGALFTGPNESGGFLRFVPVGERIPRGPSFAPRVADALACADHALDLAIGTLEPARAAR